MLSILAYLILALAAGACLPTQAGINAHLNLWTRSPVLAAAISFAVGTMALILYALADLSQIGSPHSGPLAGRHRLVRLPLVGMERRFPGSLFRGDNGVFGPQVGRHLDAGVHRRRSDAGIASAGSLRTDRLSGPDRQPVAVDRGGHGRRRRRADPLLLKDR